MVNLKFPKYMPSRSNKVRKAQIFTADSESQNASSTKSLGEVNVPARGHLLGLQVVLKAETAGSLSGPNPIDRAINELKIKDVNGKSRWTNIRGEDLMLLQRYLNEESKDITVPNANNSEQTAYFYIPYSAKRDIMPLRLEVKLNPYSSMASSGATSGDVTIEVNGFFSDSVVVDANESFIHNDKSISSGQNRMLDILPLGAYVKHTLFKVGTESNLTEIGFSEEGTVEFPELTVDELTGLDTVFLDGGHVTGQFSLYHSPYVVNTQTVFNIEASGSDTAEVFLIAQDRTNNG